MCAKVGLRRAQLADVAKQLQAVFHVGVVGFIGAEEAVERLHVAFDLRRIDNHRHGKIGLRGRRLRGNRRGGGRPRDRRPCHSRRGSDKEKRRETGIAFHFMFSCLVFIDRCRTTDRLQASYF